MNSTAYLRKALEAALRQISGVPEDFRPDLEAPKIAHHGDLSSNCAMKLARHLRRPPMQIAQAIAEHLQLDPARVASCDIARPGFINFRFSRAHFHQALAACLAAGTRYGQLDHGRGQRALVEFVSANPTGPLTVGHGRNAVLGDCIANLLEWCGYEVSREYYFNDAGRQMRVLGASVRARYEQALFESGALAGTAHGAAYTVKTIAGSGPSPVEVPASFPEDGYLGDYIIRVARALAQTEGSTLLSEAPAETFTSAAKEAIFDDIQRTLRRLNIQMDAYFNERSLYESGAVDRVLTALDRTGYVYRKEGATWLRTSVLGKDSDTVLVKQSGEPTYRLPDIAYHCDKLARGYDTCINILGADHIATYPDILRALRVLGLEAARVEVIIYQFVTLMRGGQEVKMSTRKANFVTLDELITEVGADITRYFFLMRSAGKHLEFDLDLAKEASEKNPVFYLQYAHARICSILEKAAATGFVTDRTARLDLLDHDAEMELIKQVVRFPEALDKAAATREPHRLATYLRELAEAFSRFYHHCRIIGEARAVASARLSLATAARTVLGNGLAVLGISAPEHMEKREPSS